MAAHGPSPSLRPKTSITRPPADLRGDPRGHARPAHGIPKMKLKRFLLRYYPPGIILEYDSNNHTKTKSIDLLDLTAATDAYVARARGLRVLLAPVSSFQLRVRVLVECPGVRWGRRRRLRFRVEGFPNSDAHNFNYFFWPEPKDNPNP